MDDNLKSHSLLKAMSKSKLRLVHNVAGGENVDIYIDSIKAASNVPYGKISNYLTLDSGAHFIQLTKAGGLDVLVSGSVNLMKAQDYTTIAHGSMVKANAPHGLLTLLDNNSCPAMGKAHIRFVHAAADAPKVDVYFNNALTFADVKYGTTSNPVYLPIEEGEYDVVLRLAGKMDKVLGPFPLIFDHQTYTFIASGIPGNSMIPLSLLNSIDNQGFCM